MITAFITSYLLSNIPTIQKIVDNNKSFSTRLEDCYQKALKKWCKNNDIRRNYSNLNFAFKEDLKEYISNSKGKKPSELIQLWTDEIRNDSICNNFITELKLDELSNVVNSQESLLKCINDTANNNKSLLSDLVNKGNSIESYITGTHVLIPRGRTVHKEVPNYIRRYCTSDNDTNNFLYYIEGDNKRYTLADYVTGVVNATTSKFILYSEAQSGKTTELRNLCWELQQSELYLPICFEVKTSFDLSLNQLPKEQYITGKEVVIIIDALDEINGNQRKTLLHTIEGYAFQNLTTKMVLSCRSNYLREESIPDFQELHLTELTWEDARTHIRNTYHDSYNLERQIQELNLYEFTYQPFFLNVLIEAAREQKFLPRNRIEIYELFALNSYRLEKKEKATLDTYHPAFNDVKILFEKIALVMSLYNRQSLSEEEFEACLDHDADNIAECKRYDILILEEEQYSFKHNAFREWLVASFLFEEGLEKAKELASYPNGKIKPDWYNIIILWLSFYNMNKEAQIEPIIEWLKDICLELVIYTDNSKLKENIRTELFKSIFRKYKKLGIRFSSLFSHEYKDIVQFSHSEETFKFVADELSLSNNSSAYYEDLLGICYNINWKLLQLESPKTFSLLQKTLKEKLKDELKKKPSNSIIYLVFETSFFYKEEYVKEFYELVKESTNYDAIKMLLHLILHTDTSDTYIDYILEKEKFIKDYYDGYATHVVYRDEVYDSLLKVTTPEGIQKIMSHKFNEPYQFYQSEWEKYSLLVEYSLNKAGEFIHKGYSEFIPLLEKLFIIHFGDEYRTYSKDIDSDKLLQAFRKVYHDTGLDVHEKQLFESRIKKLLSDSSNRETISLLYRKTGLWLTDELLDKYYEQMDRTNPFDNVYASWFTICPDSDLRKKASQRHEVFFPKSDSLIKMTSRSVAAMNDFANYKSFKQSVLETVGRNNISDSKKLYELSNKIVNKKLGIYIYNYILLFRISDTQIQIPKVIRSLKNRHVYDLFFMSKISEKLFNGTDQEMLTEDYKSRCLKTGKELLESINSHSYTYSRNMLKNAIGLLLHGYITISQEALLTLLPFYEVSIARNNENDFPTSYSLFDFIKENVPTDKLADSCLRLLKKESVDNRSFAPYPIVSFLIENRTAESYEILLDKAIDKDKPDIYIAEMMIKEGLMIEELKAASNQMNINDKLGIYHSLKLYQNEGEWVRNKLEPVFRGCQNHALKESLSLLTNTGSLEALKFITDDLNILRGQWFFNYDYKSADAIPMLLKVLVYVRENHISYPSEESSILSSIQNIAVQSYENLQLVKKLVKELIDQKENFKYLNRYLLQFENKYYEINKQFININDVLCYLNKIVTI